jgi:hypothetical protein
MKFLKKTLLGLAVAMISAMAISQPVAATTMTVEVTGMHYSNPTTAKIHSGDINLNVYTGAFDAIIDSKTLLAWCVDISQATIFGQIVTDYSIGSAATFGQSKIDALNLLATEALSKVTDSKTSGAFQLAAWEIVNETSSFYSLTNGNFKVDNISNSQNTLAQDWLTHLPTVSTYSVTLYSSPTMQDLAVFAKLPGLSPASVPEPATTALLGLGLFGFAASRRRQAKSQKA